MSLASVLHRNASYEELQASLSKKQTQVFECIRARGRFGATRHEVAESLNVPLASVCGRVAELEAAGLVRSDKDKRPTRYGGTATVVRVIPPQSPKTQQTLF